MLGAGALGAGVLALVSAGPASAQPPPGVLYAGQELLAGQSIASTSGQFTLTMESSGDLVEESGGTTLWSTNTHEAGSKAVMQTDGNFVVYSSTGKAEWSSGTSRHNGAYLTIGDDAQLDVTYGWGAPLWESRTSDSELRPDQELQRSWSLWSTNDLYQLVMQRDGNLVEYLYTPQVQQALWSSRTSGSGNYAVMDGDGDLQVRSPSGRVLWGTGTTGHDDAKLSVLPYADVVVTEPSGRTVWNSQSETTRTRIVAIADAQVGTLAQPADSNCNPYSGYWGSGSRCGVSGYRSEAWCADFATWVWRHAGVSFTYGWGRGDLNATAGSFYSWAVDHGRWHAASSGYVPQPGDVAVFGLNRSDDYADHAAVVVSPAHPGVDAVNGNWWDSAGSSVGFAYEENSANGSDSISGYASP